MASQGSLPGRINRAQTLKAVTKPSVETMLPGEVNRDEAQGPPLSYRENVYNVPAPKAQSQRQIVLPPSSASYHPEPHDAM